MKKTLLGLAFFCSSFFAFGQQDLAINLIDPMDQDTTIANMTYTFEVTNNGSNTIASGTDLFVEFVGITGSLTNSTPFDVTLTSDLTPGSTQTLDVSVNWNVTNPPITFDICLWLLGTSGDYDLSSGASWGGIAAVLTNDANPADNEACIEQTIGDNQAPTNILLSNTTVDENQSPGILVGTFSTVDPDSTDTHSYALVGGSGSQDNNLFQIQGGNGLVALVSFDYETDNVLHIRVETEDGPGNTYSKIFTINVNDLADVGIADHALNVPEVKVYPQPFNETTRLEFPVKAFRGNAVLKVYDASGKLVKAEAVNNNTHVFYREELAEGLYQFQLEVDGNVQYRGRLVVQ